MAAYNRLPKIVYNEFDEKAAAWLRELIRRGLIAPGDVDTRSIVDVRPDDLRGYTQCHFFAGIGVWSYALRRAGWPDDREVWTGSPPCQPFSAAGRGKGAEDERHLWPVFFGLIRSRRPAVFFGEQVASSLVVGKPGDENMQDLWARRERLSFLENRILEHLPFGLQNLPKLGGAGLAGVPTGVNSDSCESSDSVSQSAGGREGFGVRSNSGLAGTDFGTGYVPSDDDSVRSAADAGLEHAVPGSLPTGGGVYEEEHQGRAVRPECSVRTMGRESNAGDCRRGAAAALREVRQALESNAEQIANANGYSWVNALQTDVEGAGYAFGAFDLCAAGFGAPHIRQRLKFVGTRALADSVSQGLEGHRRHGDDGRQPGRIGTVQGGSVAEVGATGGLSLPDDAFWRANLSRGDFDDGTDAGRPEGAGDARTGGTGDGMADASDGHGWCGERGEEEGTGSDEVGRRGSASSSDDSRVADDASRGRGEERPHGRGLVVGDRAQRFAAGPLDGGSDFGRPGPTNGLWGDADWLLCRDGKWRPVEPGTFPLAHGSAARVGRLRGYGNAIVAQVAEGFIASYLEAEAADFDLGGEDLASGCLIDGEIEDLLA